MNGCDHQPVQADLGKAIEVASELYPDINFKHSNFPDYIKAIKEKVPNDLAVVKGELTSQDTDGWSTLINCASSHILLKADEQKNVNRHLKTVQSLSEFYHLFWDKIIRRTNLNIHGRNLCKITLTTVSVVAV